MAKWGLNDSGMLTKALLITEENRRTSRNAPPPGFSSGPGGACDRHRIWTMSQEPLHSPRSTTSSPSRAEGRHWIGGVVIAILAVVFLQVLVTNKNMQWSVVAEYMFSPAILSGSA